MIEHKMSLCYGIIVSADKMQEIQEVLTNDECDELMDNYSRCVDSWTGDKYFIGIMSDLSESEANVISIAFASFTPPDDDEDLINFKHFFDEHDLWKFIDWKPELSLINFCY